MSSFTGYITYLDYTAGSNKGDVKQGTLLNGAFKLGEAHPNYTSSVVTREAKTAGSGDTTLTLKWTPIVAGTTLVKVDSEVTDTGDGATTDYTIPAGAGVTEVTINGTKTTDYTISGTTLTFDAAPAASAAIVIKYKLFIVDSVESTQNTRSLFTVPGAVSMGKVYDPNTGAQILEFYDVDGKEITIPTTGTAAGSVTLGSVRADQKYPPQGNAGSGLATDSVTGTLTLTSTAIPANTNYSVEYTYNNEYVPQNDLPVLNVELKAIPLMAHARRIAIYFSQIAAFQAKTDYGFDLQEQLAQKATGELSYEIDTEIVEFLANMARKNTRIPNWSRVLPVGVSKAEHYEGFSEVLEWGSKLIYDATKRFAANYCVISSDIKPILPFLRGFTAAPASNINGPYFAGTVGSLKIFVSPSLTNGEYFIGVNGDDMQSSAAVYAPYMPIVPTQLLQYADGGTSQGFSTLYDLKALNENLVVGGRVVGAPFAGVFGYAEAAVASGSGTVVNGGLEG